MSAVAPARPSTATSTRRPSLASFPSSSRVATRSATQHENGTLDANHKHTRSTVSNAASAISRRSSLSAQNAPPLPSQRPLRSPQPQPRRPKPIKSQYPANSPERHVEYILVASFDIDRGSVMEHQYPGPVGGDEHMLAELMLPDQAHRREQDWTIFFLHKDAGMEEEEHDARRRGKRRRQRPAGTPGSAEDGNEDDLKLGEEEWGQEDGDDSDMDDMIADGPPLVYVLNLVNTKQDTTAKRGAICKAMAVCTRHSFLHIYKPLLVLALEQYFASPHIETLASLYNAVNSMDLSLMPRLNRLEKYLLQTSDAKDLFLERFEAIIAQRVQSMDEQLPQDPALNALDQPAMPTRTRYGLPRDTHEFESVVLYGNVPVPVKIPTAATSETVGDFSLMKLVTIFNTPHSTSPTPFNPTHPHLTTSGPLTHPIIVLLNALLTQKRIIFLGHDLPSSEVADAVLAGCALASGGLLRGFTRHAFPYTDLTKIDDLLNVPGFIAGVTNPAFATKTEWWDLLCDLKEGRMKISSNIEQVPLSEGVAFFQNPQYAGLSPSNASGGGGITALVSAGASLSAGLGGNAMPSSHPSNDATGDASFMQSVLVSIQERHGENAIRSKFRNWIAKFTRLAASFEEIVYGATALHTHHSDAITPFSPVPMSAIDSPNTPNDSPLRRNPNIAPWSDPVPPELAGHGYVWATPQARHIELSANAARIEGWRITRSYYNFVQDLAAHVAYHPIQQLDIQHLHDKLAKLRMNHDQSANIYLVICQNVNTEQEICQLLSTAATGIWDSRPTATSGNGQSQGLQSIALGLFHPRVDVREEVAALLARIKEHEAGRHFWSTLARFMRIAWHRVVTAETERRERLAADGPVDP